MKRSNSSGSNCFSCSCAERHPRLHLAFGLDLDLAQLRAQAVDVLGQVEERGLDAAHVALDPAARDRYFARLVDQAVDEVGAHAQHRAARGRRVGLRRPAPALRASAAPRLSVQRARQPRAARPGRVRGRRGRRRGWRGRSRGGRLRGRRRHGCFRFRLGRRRPRGLRVHQPVVEEPHPVERDFELVEQGGWELLEGERVLDAALHVVRQLAERHRAAHPGRALQRVERAQQGVPRGGIVGVRAPVAQALAGRRDELLRFLEEDRQQLRVDVVVEAPGAALDRDLLDLDRGRLGGRRLVLLHREGDDVARRSRSGRRLRGRGRRDDGRDDDRRFAHRRGARRRGTAEDRHDLREIERRRLVRRGSAGAGAAPRLPVGSAKSRSPRSIPGVTSAAGAAVTVSAAGREKSSESAVGEARGAAGAATGVAAAAAGTAPFSRATRSPAGCGRVCVSATVSMPPSASIAAPISERASASAGLPMKRSSISSRPCASSRMAMNFTVPAMPARVCAERSKSSVTGSPSASFACPAPRCSRWLRVSSRKIA